MTHKPPKRLGKGLSALLGDYAVEPGPADPSGPSDPAGADRGAEIARIPVAALRPNPFQPRHEVSRERLDELVGSIRENGLLQPLVVRPTPDDDAWEIVAGERRWRAVSELGWASVPAVVREIDDETMLVLALVENVQREELSPLEEARAYRRLTDEFGLTQAEVAAVVGRDRSTVANTLRLLALPEPVQALLEAGRISAGHARAILALESEDDAVALARRTAEHGLSVRAVERKVRERRAAAGESNGAARAVTAPAPAGDAYTRRAEQELARTLGTQVRVRLRGKARGRIEVPFDGPEEFDRILEAILGQAARELTD